MPSPENSVHFTSSKRSPRRSASVDFAKMPCTAAPSRLPRSVMPQTAAPAAPERSSRQSASESHRVSTVPLWASSVHKGVPHKVTPLRSVSLPQRNSPGASATVPPQSAALSMALCSCAVRSCPGITSKKRKGVRLIVSLSLLSKLRSIIANVRPLFNRKNRKMRERRKDALLSHGAKKRFTNC